MTGPRKGAAPSTVVCALCAALSVLPAVPAQEKARPAPDTPEARALRQEQVKLKELLALLARHSEKYSAALLLFVCEETLIRSEFDGSSGRRQSEDARKYDYVLDRGPSGEVVERRRPLGARGVGSPVDPPAKVPEPFLWSLLFTPRYQRLYNFRLAGQEVAHFRLATVIEFDAILPFVDGSQITQWSGRAYVDSETLDLLRIDAEPSGQQLRLDAALDDYRRAPRFIGIPLRRRPRAHQHQVQFDYERESLRLPSLAITRHYVTADGEVRNLKSQVMQIFSDYRFFRVETDEALKEIRNSVAR